jgi:hypothetical protein
MTACTVFENRSIERPQRSSRVLIAIFWSDGLPPPTRSRREKLNPR